MAVTLPLLIGTPETITNRQRLPALRTILRVPSAGHVRFRRIVAPAAPWVFAAPAISFAVLPGLVSHQTGSFEVGFAALIAGLTLAFGVSIQPLARRLDAVDDVRGTLAGLSAVTVGVLLGALAGSSHSWPLVVPAAILLGCGYGLCLVSGLLEIQRLASGEDLASLTAVFYALTYVGFAAPIVLAELERLTSATVLLLCAAALVALTAVEVAQAGSATSARSIGDGGRYRGRGGLGLPVALRRRLAVHGMDDRPGTPGGPPPGRHREPLHGESTARRTGVGTLDEQPHRRPARGGADQAPLTRGEAGPARRAARADDYEIFCSSVMPVTIFLWPARATFGWR